MRTGSLLFLALLILAALAPPTATQPGTIPPATIPPLCAQDGQRVQFVYMADDASQYAASVEPIRLIASAVNTAFLRSSGGLRSVRWAVDGSCRVDVGLLVSRPDPRTISDYARAQGLNRADRKYLLFLAWPMPLCGGVFVIEDDSAGPGNRNNTESNVGWVARQCWNGRVATHELIHLLGGVQSSAPHAGSWHHCTDGFDVVCYSGPPDYAAMTYPCGIEYQILLDCGRDDYFNVEPEPGSYLATHWNIANSGFLEKLRRVWLPVVGK
jgi:hypothetical protein